VRDQLIERIERAAPRLLLAIAGPGWGKTYVADLLAQRARRPVVCRFHDAASIDDARRIAAPLYGGPEAEAPDVIVLDDCQVLVAVAGADFFENLLGSLPRSSRVVIISRLDLPLEIDLSRHAAPHEVLTLRHEDFAFTPEQSREIIGEAGVPRRTLERAVEVSRGWPVAVLLFARIAREGALAATLSNLSGPALGDLHRYLRHQLDATTDAGELAVIVAAVGEPGATIRDLSLAIGRDAAVPISTLEDRKVKYLTKDGDRYSVVPLFEGAVEALYKDELSTARLNLAVALEAEGAFVRAARLALAAGHVDVAARALDAAGRHWPGEPVSAEYDAVANALPLPELLASRNVFVELLNNRRTRAMPDRLHERVRTFCETLSLDIDPAVRYSARIALFSTLHMTLRNREADIVAGECLMQAAAFPQWPERRELLLAQYASNLASLGALGQAERVWDEAFGDSDLDAHYEFQRFVIDFNRLLCQGNRHELDRLVETNVERARIWNEPIVFVHALAMQAAARIVTDASANVAELIARTEAPLGESATREATLSATNRFIRAFERSQPFSTPTSCLIAIDAAIGQSDAQIARTLVDAAVAGFDRMGMPFWCITGRLVRAALPNANRSAELDSCLAIAYEIDVPPVRLDVEAITEGRDVVGPLAALAQRIATSPLMRTFSRLKVSLIDCTVIRGENLVTLRHREFDLLVVLAMSPMPMSVEQLCAQLWPDADEEAATSALRMSVHRLRKQLGQNDAILSVPAGYALNADVAVDLIEAERTVRAASHLPSLGPAERSKLEPLFDRLTATPLPAYERFPWYSALERRIAELRHRLGTLLARHDLKEGATLRALERAQALLRMDPLDEPAVEIAVKAHVAAGDTAEAARDWRRYVRALDQEYGSEPTIDLSSLFKPVLLS